MGNYSKLIGAMVGSAVGIVLLWLAFRVPGLSTCDIVAGDTICSILGFSQAQITAAIMTVVNMAFVFKFPPNKP